MLIGTLLNQPTNSRHAEQDPHLRIACRPRICPVDYHFHHHQCVLNPAELGKPFSMIEVVASLLMDLLQVVIQLRSAIDKSLYAALIAGKDLEQFSIENHAIWITAVHGSKVPVGEGYGLQKPDRQRKNQ